VVVTPTASGKSLCYNLPVLDLILKDPGARALYLFPTKALAQDQLAFLTSTIDSLGADIATFTYDGDTPQDARKAIRSRPTSSSPTPTCCTRGSCRTTRKWVKLFENLRYVVIDELHMTAACTARTSRTCCGACIGCAASTAPSRNSCAAPPPSATRSSWPRRSRAAR
jgi:ATP-dependent helicase YprA (DUF1998 family)